MCESDRPLLSRQASIDRENMNGPAGANAPGVSFDLTPGAKSYVADYLMYQWPAIDRLNRSGSNPANGAGSRRYPASALNPNCVALANVSSPPPNARNPTPLSDAGRLGSGTGTFNVWWRKLSADPTYGRTQT